MDAVIYKLGDAAIQRRMLLDNAAAEFNRTVEKAARVNDQRRRVAESQWEAARKQAVRVAGVRRGIWREHEALDTGELRSRLAVHQWRLSAQYQAVQYMVTSARAAEVWYVRMIENILARRDGSRVLRVKAKEVRKS